MKEYAIRHGNVIEIKVIEFYSAYYGDLDELAESLCQIVCDKLNRI